SDWTRWRRSFGRAGWVNRQIVTAVRRADLEPPRRCCPHALAAHEAFDAATPRRISLAPRRAAWILGAPWPPRCAAWTPQISAGKARLAAGRGLSGRPRHA